MAPLFLLMAIVEEVKDATLSDAMWTVKVIINWAFLQQRRRIHYFHSFFVRRLGHLRQPSKAYDDVATAMATTATPSAPLSSFLTVHTDTTQRRRPVDVISRVGRIYRRQSETPH